MRRDVRDRVILLTGASRGIGKRVAERLAARGAKLALTARAADELAVLVAELRQAGADAEAFPADLTDPAARERLVAAVADRFGRLDVLVNCAGVASFGEFSTSTEAILRRVLEVNFFAPAELIRLSLPHLVRSYEGGPAGWRPAVLNVNSAAGRWGIPSMSEHCASKHALLGLSEGLRAEFVRFGIDVLLAIPGVVKTDDLGKHLLRNEGKIDVGRDAGDPPDLVADGVVRALTANRAEAPIGWLAWWVCFGKRAWPRLLRYIFLRKVRTFAAREKANG